MRGTTAVLVVLMVASAGFAYAGIIANPGFETGDVTGWEPFVDPDYGWPELDYGGVQMFDIKGTGTSSFAYWCRPCTGDGAGISQSLFLIGGVEYDFSVDVAAQNTAPYDVGGVAYMRLHVGGTQLAQTALANYLHMPGNSIYRDTLTGTFAPPATGSYELSVSFWRPWYQNPSIRGWVDNAVVVPEPATLSLLALAGVGLLLKRRRQA